MIKERYNRSGKRLRIIPLIVGIYGAFLGLGLMAIGFAGMGEGIGIARLLIGFGMACFGLYGIWDGVRDLVRPDKRPENPPASQFVLTDMSGNKSSNVTIGRLEEQMKNLMESGDGGSFHLQVLPPPAIQERGMLKQISCIYQDEMILIAFFRKGEGGYGICQKRTGPDEAEGWFWQLLSGSLDFSGWENVETEIHVHGKGDTDQSLEGEGGSRQHILTEREGIMTYWHQLLVIFGESWHDEHKFFSARDVELAVEGVHDGKYQKVMLEWGNNVFDILSGQGAELMVLWQTNDSGKRMPRVLMREGTVTQVKFWLNHYLNRGSFEEMGGWTDITVQVEKEWRKYGKVF